MPEATRDIPKENSIKSFAHCARCIKERPKDVTPRDWAQLEVGFTKLGIQVWCRRHECNVIHIDFQKTRHPANMDA